LERILSNYWEPFTSLKLMNLHLSLMQLKWIQIFTILYAINVKTFYKCIVPFQRVANWYHVTRRTEGTVSATDFFVISAGDMRYHCFALIGKQTCAPIRRAAEFVRSCQSNLINLISWEICVGRGETRFSGESRTDRICRLWSAVRSFSSPSSFSAANDTVQSYQNVGCRMFQSSLCLFAKGIAIPSDSSWREIALWVEIAKWIKCPAI